jgi:hypothetical protein
MILEASGGINIDTYESIEDLAEAAMYKAWARDNFSQEMLQRLQSKINEMINESEVSNHE